MTELILFDFDQASGIAVMTINRPEVRNALNREAMEALEAAVWRAAETPELRALILTGAGGRSFIAGGDIRDLHNDISEDGAIRQHDLMTNSLDRLSALHVPIICAMEGATRGGGCEVALACDLRVMAEDASLSFAQVTMGVTPGWGGAGRLFNLLGYSRSMDLLMTGRVIEADEALTLGLINRIAPQGESLNEAREMAERILQGPPMAVSAIKQVLHGYLTLTHEAAKTRERSSFVQLWASEDHAEASSAFLEKRSPTFKGA